MTLGDIYGKRYLVVVCHSSTYKIVKVMKLFRKIALKDSGIVFTMVIISFYNYYYHHLSLLSQFLLSRAPRSNQFQRLGVSHYLTVDSTFRKIWAVPKRLIFWSSSILMFPGIFSTYFPRPFFLTRPSAPLTTGTVSVLRLVCENIYFSSLFAGGDVSRRGTSATQRQEFHTDDANQRLHSKSGSHGVPKVNLPNFTCLLVDFGIVLCSSANELLQNSNASSREDYIPQILNVFVRSSRFYLTFVAFCLLSVICKQSGISLNLKTVMTV